jgi:O-antigen/teichoic acid export membrane protein
MGRWRQRVRAVRRGVASRSAALPVVGKFLGGDPLLRNGVVLTMAALSTSALGAAYWSLVGLTYSVADVGRNYSAISVMMFLAGVSQLSLADVLVRFVPAAGPRTRRLIGGAYTATVLMALLTSGLFVLLVPTISPALDFLHGPLLGPVFILATVAYAIFVVQDGALTGLRRPSWVLAENALFSTAKLAAVAAFAVLLPVHGILLSWVLALLVSLVFTNTYIFGFAIPRREREIRRFQRRPSWALDPQPGDGSGAPVLPSDSTRGVVRFTALTYGGGLFWLGATTLPQVLLLNTLGARASAYFSISWIIIALLMVVSTNMGSSIVVDSAGDPRRLRRAALTVLRHAGLLLVAAAGLLMLAAPLVLRLFGEDYPEHATLLLRLLALSTIPNLVNATALACARVRRRAGLVVAIYLALSGLVFSGAAVFVPRLGLEGMGVAWLCAQLAVSSSLLLLHRIWLPAPDAPPERGDAVGELSGSAPAAPAAPAARE